MNDGTGLFCPVRCPKNQCQRDGKDERTLWNFVPNVALLCLFAPKKRTNNNSLGAAIVEDVGTTSSRGEDGIVHEDGVGTNEMQTRERWEMDTDCRGADFGTDAEDRMGGSKVAERCANGTVRATFGIVSVGVDVWVVPIVDWAIGWCASRDTWCLEEVEMLVMDGTPGALLARQRDGIVPLDEWWDTDGIAARAPGMIAFEKDIVWILECRENDAAMKFFCRGRGLLFV